MTILNVEEAAKFLKISTKIARALIVRLPHGDTSRGPGPNKKLVIAQETLEKFVLGEIKPVPVGHEGETVKITKATETQRKKKRNDPVADGPIPKRPYTR